MNKPFAIKIISWLFPFVVLLGTRIFPKPLVVLCLFLIWIIYKIYIMIVYRNQVIEVLTQLFTMFSLVWLLLLVESIFLQWLIVISAIPFFFFLIWMNSEQTGRLVHIKEKPLRRMRMMIHVFNMYAGCIALFAVNVYFPSIPVFVLMCGGGVYAAITSFLIWKLYFKSGISMFFLPLIVVMIGVTECMWAMRLLPFGYLAQGLLVVWIWYILQLLVRFHLSPRGIIWKEQTTFLSANIILFIGVLFFIRWV